MGYAKINFLRQGFEKLSSDGHTYIYTDRYRETDGAEFIYHAASRVVNKQQVVAVTNDISSSLFNHKCGR